MISQTISLFRYQMLAILSKRLLVLYVLIVGVALLTGGFISELAIINREAVVAATVAEFSRYSLAILVLLLVSINVVEDFESRQFERLLTMPLARWQYIIAQTLVVLVLCLLLSLPLLPLVSFLSSFEVAAYWATGLWLEFCLLGLLAMFAALSLEKIPMAVFFSLAIYLLAKLSNLILLMVSETVRLSEGSASSEFTSLVFTSILHLIPGTSSFANSDAFFDGFDQLSALGTQFVSVIIYAALLVAASLVDFYRKELHN